MSTARIHFVAYQYVVLIYTLIAKKSLDDRPVSFCTESLNNIPICTVCRNLQGKPVSHSDIPVARNHFIVYHLQGKPVSHSDILIARNHFMVYHYII